jgi:hypothetical protein
MAGSMEGPSGGLAGSGEELGSEWEVKSCGGSSVHSQVTTHTFPGIRQAVMAALGNLSTSGITREHVE